MLEEGFLSRHTLRNLAGVPDSETAGHTVLGFPSGTCRHLQWPRVVSFHMACPPPRIS